MLQCVQRGFELGKRRLGGWKVAFVDGERGGGKDGGRPRGCARRDRANRFGWQRSSLGAGGVGGADHPAPGRREWEVSAGAEGSQKGKVAEAEIKPRCARASKGV